jgi:hypothetical protein
MKIDPLHYVDWVVWAGTTYTHLAPEARDRFTIELLTVLSTSAALFDDLPHGKGLGLALAVAKWLTKHPDPLAPVRSAMDQMQKRWSTNAEGAPA